MRGYPTIFTGNGASSSGTRRTDNARGQLETGRFLFWTVDNRMHAAVDDKHYSYYTYDYTGERRLKLTGESNRLDVNADFMTTGTLLNTPTLYPSAYLVLTNKGYTKHYYAGADRVAASLGGGGLKATGSNPGMQDRADWLFWESHERVNGRMLQENDHECIWQGNLFTQEYYESIKDIPGRMNASVEFYLNDLYDNLKMLAEEQHQEKDVYFYHSDHLGSASWITDGNGKPIQHLQYLPFGEPFVNQHLTDYQERYLFTGKERDEETGYGYFGARYMDHELTAMWISVDPMADKYPSISPYAYCAWNPIRLVDPDGRQIDEWQFNVSTGEIIKTGSAGGNSHQTITFINPDGTTSVSEYDGNTIQLDYQNEDGRIDYRLQVGTIPQSSQSVSVDGLTSGGFDQLDGAKCATEVGSIIMGGASAAGHIPGGIKSAEQYVESYKNECRGKYNRPNVKLTNAKINELTREYKTIKTLGKIGKYGGGILAGYGVLSNVINTAHNPTAGNITRTALSGVALGVGLCFGGPMVAAGLVLYGVFDAAYGDSVFDF